jgi:hypothetical protein
MTAKHVLRTLTITLMLLGEELQQQRKCYFILQHSAFMATSRLTLNLIIDLPIFKTLKMKESFL